jgi:uncharacterized protein YjbK
MTQEIEIEFKNLLTYKEFLTLKEAFHLNETDFAIQHNDYFDTPSFDLKAHGSALRIREKQGKLVLTLKEPGDIGLIETHQSLTKEKAREIIRSGELPPGEVHNAIQRFNISIKTFNHLGRLSTHRAEIPYQNGLLVLDHSLYGHTEDYELEYEVLEPVQGKRVFLELLEKFEIPVRPTENKIRRLMNAISKM